jgi:alginate O-acetyltransferase complex protein AlgJ
MHRILLILLILPAALWIAMPERSALVLENRNRAEMPALPAALSGLTDYLAGVDAFVADNIGLRDQLMTVKNRLNRVINGKSNSRVIAGEDGWLFYNAAQVVERNAGLIFQPERVENMLRYAQEAQDLANAQGAHFIAMPVPNSHALYRKHLPAWARPKVDPYTEQRAIAEGLKAKGLPISDPYVLFRDRDLEALPLYFRRDTHWNGYGAYIAFHDAMAQFGLADFFPAPESILKGYVQGEYYGVLDQFLGLDKAAESEPLPDLDMTQFDRHPELSAVETDDHVSMDSYDVTYAPEGPRLLVIGDSFSYSFFRKYWGAGFSAVHWSHHDYGRYDRSVFNRFKPDYVIFEFVDWEVPAWVAFDTRPSSP